MSVAVLEKPTSEEIGGEFTRWHGTCSGPPPLPMDVQVEVILYQDVTCPLDKENREIYRTDLVGNWDWYWSTTAPCDGCIIGYRVVRDSPTDPGWRPWDPTTRKKPPHGHIKVQLRNGTIAGPKPSGSWAWGGSGQKGGEIVSYQVMTASGTPEILPTSDKIVPWRPTARSQCPLPGTTLVRTRLRAGQDFGQPHRANSFCWNRVDGNDRKGDSDIVEYVVEGDIPDGWQIHQPSARSKRPTGMGVVVDVRTRDGAMVSGYAYKFNWRQKFKSRDSEIVAWRKKPR